MEDKQIPGGATIWARKTIDSEIFYDKPDKWFKIWFYLVNRVNHTKNRKWDRGECHITYDEIKLKTKATKSQIDHCIRYLKREAMLATRKATRGMHLNVVKYILYQNLENYKSDTESELKAKQRRNRSDTINKNDKNEKNVNTIVIRDYWNSFKTPIKISGNIKNITVKQIGLLKECRRETDDLIKAYKDILKKYKEEDIKMAIRNYITEIVNRDPQNNYAVHRFSLYQFLKQKNGFTKFINEC